MTEDHWLRMRDTGFVDEEGFLNLTGRCSDMVSLGDTGSEENIFVTPLEQRVRLELACVAQVCVVTSPARTSLGPPTHRRTCSPAPRALTSRPKPFEFISRSSVRALVCAGVNFTATACGTLSRTFCWRRATAWMSLQNASIIPVQKRQSNSI